MGQEFIIESLQDMCDLMCGRVDDKMIVRVPSQHREVDIIGFERIYVDNNKWERDKRILFERDGIVRTIGIFKNEYDAYYGVKKIVEAYERGEQEVTITEVDR